MTIEVDHIHSDFYQTEKLAEIAEVVNTLADSTGAAIDPNRLLPEGYSWQKDSTTGALKLLKGTQVVSTQNVDGSWFKDAVSTGVGSFHLGAAHSIGSAGQNVIFKNDHSDLCFFPLWQGQSKDGTQLIEPSIRVFSNQIISTPNGLQSTEVVDYLANITATANISFTKVEVMPAETYVGDLVWTVMFSSSQIEISRVLVKNCTTDVALAIPFDYPLDIRNGDSITARILKQDGNLLKVKAGATDTTSPYRKTWSRTFTDGALLTDQGITAPDGLELVGWPESPNYIISQGVSINTNGTLYSFKDRVLTSISYPAGSTPVATALNLGNTQAYISNPVATLSTSGTISNLIGKELRYTNGNISATLPNGSADFPKLEVLAGTLTMGNTSGTYDLVDFSSLKTLGGFSVSQPLDTLPSFPKVTNAYTINIGSGWTGTNLVLDGVKYSTVTITGSQITSISLPNCTNLSSSVTINSNGITSISLPSLVTSSNSISITSLANVSLSMPNATNLGDLNIICPMTELSLPKVVNMSLMLKGSIDSISTPLLESMGSFSLDVSSSTFTVMQSVKTIAYTTRLASPTLTSFSFANVTYIGALTISATLLTSLSWDNVTYIGNKWVSNQSIAFGTGVAITNFALPSGLKEVAGGINIPSSSLTAAAIDAMFNKLASLDGTNGTVLYQNKAVTIKGAAAPTSASATARATLTSRGCTVTI